MNHRDTKTQRKAHQETFYCAFLCVFVSLWFITLRFFVLVPGTSLEFFSFYQS